jgi:DNA-binding NtrC family response regulator
VVPIRVPPLRERPEDIPVLAEHFLLTYWERHRPRSAEVPQFTTEALRALQSKSWPGNVRELQNAIEHAVVFLDPGADIGPDDVLSTHLEESHAAGSSPFDFEWTEEQYHQARDRVTAEFERRYLTWVLNRANGNVSKASRMAGIDRTTIYRLMERHGLMRDAILASRDK